MRATSHLVPRPAAGAIPGAAVPVRLVADAEISAGLIPAGEAAGSDHAPAGDVPAGEVPGGAATATLLAVVARTAWTIRCIALVYIVVQVVIWHSFFTARPERLAGPVVTVLCVAAVVARLRWWPRPGWRLAAADTGVVAVLALSAWWCVPPAMQGDTSSWLYIAVVSQMIIPAWFAPAAALIPLTVVSSAAFWIGAARGAPARPGATSPAAAVANLVATAAAAWCALWLLGRRARAADAALARADAESRADYVELTLSTERREHERLLHDTVLNTLTALGRDGGGPGGAGPADDLDQAAAAARCQHDITLIEHALGAAGDAGRLAAGGLLVATEAAAAEMGARGLTVHAAAHGALAEIPDAVATALALAAREALANVARHAGTAEAWLEISAVGGAGPGGGVEVTVRDHGAGFDPARVDPARLGLRRSIAERVADWGGHATVHSALGKGTVVSMRWLAPDPAPGQAPDPAPGPISDPPLSPVPEPALGRVPDPASGPPLHPAPGLAAGSPPGALPC
jgi:signal transduction histidine kinase